MAVVLKPPTHQHKPSLSERGWVGKFLGRSRYSKGSYDVMVDGQIVSSSCWQLVGAHDEADRPGVVVVSPYVSSTLVRAFVAEVVAIIGGSLVYLFTGRLVAGFVLETRVASLVVECVSSVADARCQRYGRRHRAPRPHCQR